MYNLNTKYIHSDIASGKKAGNNPTLHPVGHCLREKGSVLVLTTGSIPGANPGVADAKWCQRGVQQI